MTTTPTRPVWPPPAGSALPEPLLSHVHAIALTRLHTTYIGPGSDRDLTGRPRWHRTLRAQLRDAVEPTSTVRRDLARHLRAYDVWGQDDDERVDGVLRSVVSELCLFERRPDVPWEDDRATATWMQQWADQTPWEDWTRLPQTTALDLLAVRLEMTDLDAIAEVLRADPDAALRSFVGHDHWPTDRSCLSIDRHRVAAAFPACDADELCHLVARALGRRHVVGLLERDELARLGLTPIDHPCGFDTAYRDSNTELADLRRALTGSESHETIVVEWARHRWLSWGEDQDLMFFESELPGLRASLDDPANVKVDEVRWQIEKIERESRRNETDRSL